MRWLLMMAFFLTACSPPGPGPGPTPVSTPTAASAPAPADWHVYYGDSGGFTGGGRWVDIWADGSVYAQEDEGLRKLVGRIPPPELAPFAAALAAPELAKVSYDKPGNMTTSLSWFSGRESRRWAWPQGEAGLPTPLTRALDELDHAQAAMQPAEDDGHFTVGGERLAVTRSQLTIPAVGGQPSTWAIEAGKHKLSVKAEVKLVEELKGKSFAVKGGQLQVTDVHNGIVEATFPGGSLKTDVRMVALP